MIKSFEQFTCEDCIKNITESSFNTNENSRDYSRGSDFFKAYDVIMDECLDFCIKKVKEKGGEVNLEELGVKNKFLYFYKDLIHKEEKDMSSYAGTAKIYFDTIKVVSAQKKTNPLNKDNGEQFPRYTNKNGEYLVIVAKNGSELRHKKDNDELRVDRRTVTDRSLLELSDLLGTI